VFNDHVLFHNQKFNSYLHISEDCFNEQLITKTEKSVFRPPSPVRKPNPTEIFKTYDVNMSENFYKWRVISYRQIKDKKDAKNFLFSGEVITLKHAETGGILCYDDLSNKKHGDPVYVRIYKGLDAKESITTNCLFEVEVHVDTTGKDATNQGTNLLWKKL